MRTLQIPLDLPVLLDVLSLSHNGETWLTLRGKTYLLKLRIDLIAYANGKVEVESEGDDERELEFYVMVNGRRKYAGYLLRE